MSTINFTQKSDENKRRIPIDRVARKRDMINLLTLYREMINLLTSYREIINLLTLYQFFFYAGELFLTKQFGRQV